MDYPCPFCDQIQPTPQEHAAHVLSEHSFNVAGENSPNIKGAICRLWYEDVKRRHGKRRRVRCFCGDYFAYLGPCAPFFYTWMERNSAFADHLAEVGGMAAHCEDITLNWKLSRIEDSGRQIRKIAEEHESIVEATA